MAVAIVIAIGVFFLGMGLYALATPAALVRPFGVGLEGSTARSEVRAVYGGFGLAMAAMLSVAATDIAGHRLIIVTIAVALGGMAVGRLISAVIDARTAFYPNWFYCLVELAAAGALYWTTISAG